MTRTPRRHLGRPWQAAPLVALAAALSIQGCGGDDLKCGGPFCVSPGPPQATTLTLGSGGGQTGAPGRELPQPIVVVVTDDDERPIADVPVSFSVSQGGGSVSEGTVQSDIEGRALVGWTLGPDPGTQSVQAAASASSGSPLGGSPLSVSAEAVRPPPVRLVLQSPPSDTVHNGVQFQRQPIVEVLDEDDQPVPQVQVTVTIADGGGTLSGTTGVSSDATGRATYTDLALVGSRGARTLRFSVADPALEVASGPVVLEAGGAAAIAGVAPLDYQATVNSPVSPAPSVVVRDATGNPVPGVAVTFTADRDASVSPLSVTTDQAGVGQVTTWTLGTTANVQYSLTARIAGSTLSPVIFTAMARAGAEERLQIARQPSSSAQNGVALSVQPVIQVTDRNGNPAPESGVRITASVTTGSGTLENATATTNASGRATFSGLTITGAVDNYILSFSASRLEGIASNVIALAPGAAAKLALASSSPAARSRQPLTPQPSLQVQDASGNPVGQAGITVAASLTGDGTLGGQASVTTDGNGRASFTDLTITGAPGSRTLNFSSTNPALDGASVPITLPAVASIEAQPAPPNSAVAGSTVSFAWVLRDTDGQPVPDVAVDLSVSAGTLAPPAGATSDASGIVQVQWTLPTVIGDQVADAKKTSSVAIPGGGPSAQVQIKVLPDQPRNLVYVSGNQQSAPPDSALEQHLIVRVTDQHGNGVSGVAVQWRACDGSGGFDASSGVDGSSAARQPTGPQTGAFCTHAISEGLQGSPVQFDYTVEPQPTPPSQLRSSQRSGARPEGLAPVAAPRSPAARSNSR
jgi:adhesin/invasin